MGQKSQNFLLIEHGGSRKQFTLKTLEEKGLTVYLACTSMPEWLMEHIPLERIIVTDTYNSVKLIADVVCFFESNGINIHGVGTFYEHVVCQAADLASALKLTGLNPGAARRSSSNKLLTRMNCRDAGIPTPKFKVVNGLNYQKLSLAVEDIGRPCVVKPIFGAESYGTMKIENRTSLKKVIEEIKLNTTPEKKETYKNFTGWYLVEEYLSGLVVSVDGLVQNKKNNDYWNG